MARNLFLDANVYLSFYLFGKDDLEEMAKVVKLIGDEEITLHTNSHLRSEIMRNRETKIAEGLSSLKSISFSREYPHFFGDFAELAEIRSKLKEVSKLHSTLVDKARLEIDSRTLRADKLIDGLLSLGTNNIISEADVHKAGFRCELGEPPGKRGSIGDAIHWQSLLEKNLYYVDFVTLDGDFSSPLDPSVTHPYLNQEWKTAHGGAVNLFRSLSDYFKVSFPSVVLSDEFEKDSLISRLQLSGSFSETHAIIAELASFISFTKAQIRGLFAALLENTQVGWIATDDDVKSFFLRFKAQAWHLKTQETNAACELFELPSDYFDIEF